MPVLVTGKMKHANGRDAVADAADIEMPDGSRLSEFNPVFPTLEGTAVLEPEKHYVFGAVTELAVVLAQKDDGKAHEYWFEFEPEEGFGGLTIEPAPKWVGDPQYPVGKTCLVGIYMGMAVMAIA